MRGNLTLTRMVNLYSRSIPASAGGTGSSTAPMARASGLSPRVRGNPGHGVAANGDRGSIPASAGEPHIQDTGRCRGTVYPRECGGTAYSGYRALSRDGLSPRVRGNLGASVTNTGAWRSIPASAGEPLPYPKSVGNTPVYPRECGGTRSGPSRRLHRRGLSPRVRGNQ